MKPSQQRDELLFNFKKDKFLAHKALFPNRHKDHSPAFHKEILELLYSPHPRVAMMAFRGAAKSTLLEEYVLLSMLFREFQYALFVGPKWGGSLASTLTPIRNELEMNDILIELFGDQKSTPWSMDELQLANGGKIKAFGAGQSMRGTKSNDERPDLAAIDDLEDETNIGTEESRHKTDRWLMGTLIPALHPTKGKVRFIGTAIHPKALIEKKCKDPKWVSAKFPILNTDLTTGREVSAWPDRFPLGWVESTRNELLHSGNLIEFEQEYMCRAEDMAGKPFQARMIQVQAAPCGFLPVEIFVDPARTTKLRSSRTGYAAWSWQGNKLIVHEAEGHFHKPDEIIKKIVEWDHRFSPVTIGVEAVGLEEFLMQPLRMEMLRLGRAMPVRDIRAPQDKDRFIEGMQPFYTAGDVIHAKHLPDLETELLQFPTGRKDVVNALAYALRMRAGKPVYEDFTFKHVAKILEVHPRKPLFLCVSSRPAQTAGVLVQYIDGLLRIYQDWVINEPPQECFGRLLREAVLFGGQVKLSAPMEQFDRYNNYGLPAAVKREGLEIIHARPAAKSEGQMRDWLRRQVKGDPAVLVSADSRWVVNGFMRGYARRLEKGGVLADFPTEDGYRLVFEALESFVGYFDGANVRDDNTQERHYDYTSDGQAVLKRVAEEGDMAELVKLPKMASCFVHENAGMILKIYPAKGSRLTYKDANWVLDSAKDALLDRVRK